MKKFDIITIFPEMFQGVFSSSLLGKAREKDLLEINIHNLRDWSQDKHNSVDDRPYGGGPGMVIKPGPVFRAVEACCSRHEKPSHLVLFSPRGTPLNQEKVEQFADQEANLMLLCGHYEGFDERIRKGLDPDEISIGDYVLSGGEIPAMVLVDSVSRLVPGVVGSRKSIHQESFTAGPDQRETKIDEEDPSDLLDHPQYTRPRSFRGMEVPEVLLSGDHERIRKWRKQKARELTEKRRPDLLE